MTSLEYAKKMFRIDVKQHYYDEDRTVKTWDDLSQEEQGAYIKEANAYLKLPEEEWVDFAYYGV